MEEEPSGREARTMIRIRLLVEGQTEEAFVNEMLAPHYARQGIYLDAMRSPNCLPNQCRLATSLSVGTGLSFTSNASTAPS